MRSYFLVFYKPALILTIAFSAWWGVLANEVQAFEPELLTVCPLTETLSASLVFPDQTRTIDNVYSDEITIQNNSDYIVPGVRLALAFYAPGSLVPSHVAVVGEGFDLTPLESTARSFTVGAENLPASQYEVEAFIAQGDVETLVGTILKGGNNKARITLEKNTPAVSKFTFRLAVDGVESNTAFSAEAGKPIVVSSYTTNEQATPVFNEKMLLMLTKGTVPLGAAVDGSAVDNLKLLPGSTRETKVQSPFSFAGRYTVVSTLVTPGTVNAISVLPLIVGDSSGAHTSFPYLEAVGLTPYNTNDGVTMVACVKNTNPTVPVRDVKLEISGQDITNPVVSSVENALQFSVPSLTPESPVNVILQTPMQRSVVRNQEDSVAKAEEGYVAAATFQFLVPSCERYKICSDSEPVSNVALDSNNNENWSVWINWGALGVGAIMIVALLWLWLRPKNRSQEKIIMTKPDNS